MFFSVIKSSAELERDGLITAEAAKMFIFNEILSSFSETIDQNYKEHMTNK